MKRKTELAFIEEQAMESQRLKQEEESKENPGGTVSLAKKMEQKGSLLTRQEFKELAEEFKEAFHDLEQSWKPCKLEPVELEIQKGATQKRFKERQYSNQDQEEIGMDIEDLLKKGILQETKERPEWVSSLTVARPPAHRVRVCLDVRELNKNLIDAQWSMPTVDEVIQQLAGARYFSKIDLKSGYFQLELSPRSKKLVGICYKGKFYF